MSQINREDALNVLKIAYDTCGADIDTFYKTAMGAIKTLPSTERTGKWIYRVFNSFHKYEVECSECGAKYTGNYGADDGPIDFNCCPDCGADMRGEEE